MAAQPGPSGSRPPGADPTPFTIKIKTMQPAVHEMEVTGTMTVTELKNLIEPKVNLAPARQRLIYKGRVLLDTQTIAETGVEPNHTLHLVERPADAPPPGADTAPPPTQTAAGSAPLDLNRIIQSIMQSLGGAGGPLGPAAMGGMPGARSPAAAGGAPGGGPGAGVAAAGAAGAAASGTLQTDHLLQTLSAYMGNLERGAFSSPLMNLSSVNTRLPTGRSIMDEGIAHLNAALAHIVTPSAVPAPLRPLLSDLNADLQSRSRSARSPSRAAAPAPPGGASSGAAPAAGAAPAPAPAPGGQQQQQPAYPFHPLVLAAISDLATRAGQYGQRDFATALLRDATALQESAEDLDADGTAAAATCLRSMSATLHVYSALLVDLSRAACAAALSLEGNTSALSHNAAAVIHPDATGPAFPRLLPRTTPLPPQREADRAMQGHEAVPVDVINGTPEEAVMGLMNPLMGLLQGIPGMDNAATVSFGPPDAAANDPNRAPPQFGGAIQIDLGGFDLGQLLSGLGVMGGGPPGGPGAPPSPAGGAPGPRPPMGPPPPPTSQAPGTRAPPGAGPRPAAPFGSPQGVPWLGQQLSQMQMQAQQNARAAAGLGPMRAQVVAGTQLGPSLPNNSYVGGLLQRVRDQGVHPGGVADPGLLMLQLSSVNGVLSQFMTEVAGLLVARRLLTEPPAGRQGAGAGAGGAEESAERLQLRRQEVDLILERVARFVMALERTMVNEGQALTLEASRAASVCTSAAAPGALQAQTPVIPTPQPWPWPTPSAPTPGAPSTSIPFPPATAPAPAPTSATATATTAAATAPLANSLPSAPAPRSAAAPPASSPSPSTNPPPASTPPSGPPRGLGLSLNPAGRPAASRAGAGAVPRRRPVSATSATTTTPTPGAPSAAAAAQAAPTGGPEVALPPAMDFASLQQAARALQDLSSGPPSGGAPAGGATAGLPSRQAGSGGGDLGALMGALGGGGAGGGGGANPLGGLMQQMMASGGQGGAGGGGGMGGLMQMAAQVASDPNMQPMIMQAANALFGGGGQGGAAGGAAGGGLGSLLGGLMGGLGGVRRLRGGGTGTWRRWWSWTTWWGWWGWRTRGNGGG